VYLAGAIPLIVGALWLVAWLSGAAVTWARNGVITVKTNMAMAQIAAGAALLLGTSPRAGWRRTAAMVLSVLVFLLGALTLVEHLFSCDLGIDQWLAREPPGAPATDRPNRIGPPGAVTLSLIGGGLAALVWGARRMAFYAGLVTCLLSIVPGVGFLYGASQFYGVAGLSGIAAPTVVTALALGLGLMLAVGDDGPLALLRRNDLGGDLLRRTLGWALLIPVLLGFVVVLAERHSLVETASGLGALALAELLLLAVWLWKSAARLSDVAAVRARDERALQETLAQAEEGRRILHVLMEHVPEGITIADAPEGTIRMVSRYGTEKLGIAHTGITAATVAGNWTVFRSNGRDLMPADELPLLRAIKKGEVVTNAELVQVSERGDRVVLLCNAAPIRSADGSITGGIVAWRDVSEIRRAQDALRASEASLREADRRKNEFLGMLSHELRNPLAPIRNSLYVLDRVPPGSEQAQRAHAIVERQIAHMTRLVDDLLDVTRISRGKIHLQRARLNLVDLVRDTVEDHRTLLAKHDLAVQLPSTPVWIHGDGTRLAQALGNLVHNAAKFTPEGGQVTVSLGTRVGEAVLEVVDSGMGIDADTLARLFEPFAQADRSLDRSRGGLGLGLSLVKGMVDLHQGTVTADSAGPGRGARFTIALPLDEDGGPQRARAPQGTVVPRNVLVIEDHPDAAESLSDALTIAGHKVTVAHDGETGIRRALELRPDVVVCDIGLPCLDGYAVARTLRGAGLQALLIALSGYAQPDDVSRAKEAGFDAHLAKPADQAALQSLLGRAPTAR
jgi:PAS domain S-box-containing protein